MGSSGALLQQGRDPTSDSRPWEAARFSKICPGSSDAWNVDWVAEGWLIRIHSKQRKRWFIPLHRSLPLRAERLGCDRVTVRFLENGQQVITEGDWRQSTKTPDDSKWRGYTFFRVHPEAHGERQRTSVEVGTSGVYGTDTPRKGSGGLFDDARGLLEQPQMPVNPATRRIDDTEKPSTRSSSSTTTTRGGYAAAGGMDRPLIHLEVNVVQGDLTRLDQGKTATAPTVQEPEAVTDSESDGGFEFISPQWKHFLVKKALSLRLKPDLRRVGFAARKRGVWRMTRTNPLSMQQVYLIPEAFLSGSKQVRTPADAIIICLYRPLLRPNVTKNGMGTTVKERICRNNVFAPTCELPTTRLIFPSKHGPRYRGPCMCFLKATYDTLYWWIVHNIVLKFAGPCESGWCDLCWRLCSGRQLYVWSAGFYPKLQVVGFLLDPEVGVELFAYAPSASLPWIDGSSDPEPVCPFSPSLQEFRADGKIRRSFLELRNHQWICWARSTNTHLVYALQKNYPSQHGASTKNSPSDLRVDPLAGQVYPARGWSRSWASFDACLDT